MPDTLSIIHTESHSKQAVANELTQAPFSGNLPAYELGSGLLDSVLSSGLCPLDLSALSVYRPFSPVYPSNRGILVWD